jgi:hypothetical protein
MLSLCVVSLSIYLDAIGSFDSRTKAAELTLISSDSVVFAVFGAFLGRTARSVGDEDQQPIYETFDLAQFTEVLRLEWLSQFLTYCLEISLIIRQGLLRMMDFLVYRHSAVDLIRFLSWEPPLQMHLATHQI